MKLEFKTPPLKIVIRVYYDPTYSDEYPWVIEIDNEIQNSWGTLKAAKEFAYEMARADFMHEIDKVVYPATKEQ